MQQVVITPDEKLKPLSSEDAKTIASFFQVLADPTRVRLIKALSEGKWCVSDLVHALEMDQPAISHQLKHLRKLRLVKYERIGRHVYYTLNDQLTHRTLQTVIQQLQITD